MNRRLLAATIIITLSVLSVIVTINFQQNGLKKPGSSQKISMQTIKLTSPSFENNTTIPARFTCDGENVNPPLGIGKAPSDTKSLTLIMDDPDAPVGVWDHWIKFNIPPDTKVIEEDREPEGISGKGSGGNLSYQGPCPPSGVHHYIFKIYALDTALALPEGSSKAAVESAMSEHILGKGELVGFYSRQ